MVNKEQHGDFKVSLLNSKSLSQKQQEFSACISKNVKTWPQIILEYLCLLKI